MNIFPLWFEQVKIKIHKMASNQMPQENMVVNKRVRFFIRDFRDRVMFAKLDRNLLVVVKVQEKRKLFLKSVAWIVCVKKIFE